MAGRLWSRYLSLTLLALIPAISAAQQRQPEVRVEKKPTYLPAGRGQTPWDVTRHTIPLGEIQAGGPPRDGIPALNFPAFVPAEAADRLLRPSDFVLGIAMDGQAKAYPVRILNWHELVNDDIAGHPVLVSW
jgi:hypothetical protein